MISWCSSGLFDCKIRNFSNTSFYWLNLRMRSLVMVPTKVISPSSMHDSSTMSITAVLLLLHYSV